MVTGKKIVWTDFVVIGTILFMTFIMFFKNQARGSFDPNTMLSPDDVNTILNESIKGSPLDKLFQANTFSGTVKNSYFLALNALSQQSFFNPILHFINKNQGIVEDCSACATDISCGDSSQPIIAYPVDLTIKALHVKMLQYPKLMIIDVRNSKQYLISHIPSSVNLPLLDLVDQIYTVDRWMEIVIVGDNYMQTKLAGESLIRLNFHRVHRLIVPVTNWDKVLESYL